MEPVRVVLSFIDCVNQGDVEGLGRLMTDDHKLTIFDEPAVIGREANLAAWRAYAESYPAYVIHLHRITDRATVVAVLGHTTGSHLGLSDEEESQLTLIWLAEVHEGAIRCWQLIEDTPDSRRQFRLEGDA